MDERRGAWTGGVGSLVTEGRRDGGGAGAVGSSARTGSRREVFMIVVVGVFAGIVVGIIAGVFAGVLGGVFGGGGVLMMA